MTPPSLASSFAVLACPNPRRNRQTPLDRLPEENPRTHLDVCDALKVGDEVLDEALPCREALDEDVRGAQLEGAWCNGVEESQYPGDVGSLCERFFVLLHPLTAERIPRCAGRARSPCPPLRPASSLLALALLSAQRAHAGLTGVLLDELRLPARD